MLFCPQHKGQNYLTCRRDQVNSKRKSNSIRFQILFKVNMKILIKTCADLTVPIYPKITKINLTIN